MLTKVKKFTLKQRDFASGKMVSPPRNEWETCDCCGKAIVQGVILSNGDKIGNDCEELRWRIASDARCGLIEQSLKTFKSWGTAIKAQSYMLQAYYP